MENEEKNIFGKTMQFLTDSKNEMIENVTWTPFEELQKSADLVLVASAIFAVIIGIIDMGFDNGLEFLYKYIQK